MDFVPVKKSVFVQETSPAAGYVYYAALVSGANDYYASCAQSYAAAIKCSRAVEVILTFYKTNRHKVGLKLYS